MDHYSNVLVEMVWAKLQKKKNLNKSLSLKGPWLSKNSNHPLMYKKEEEKTSL